MTAVVMPVTKIAIPVTKQSLRQAIFDYIVQSRTGDNTLSYTTTAAMSAEDVADSSTERLWALLDNPQQDLYDDQQAMMLGQPAADAGPAFTF